LKELEKESHIDYTINPPKKINQEVFLRDVKRLWRVFWEKRKKEIENKESSKMVSFKWRQLGYKLGQIEKRNKLHKHLCDELLPYVERIVNEIKKEELSWIEKQLKEVK